MFLQRELLEEATVANFATVQMEGDREITGNITHYNLDVIISVGYRVKSLRGTQFRIWAIMLLSGWKANNERSSRQVSAPF